MSPRTIALHDLPSLVGSVFTIDKFRIGQDEVNTFEDVTGVTATYGQTLPTDYPDGMIEGFHSLALLDYLLHQLIRLEPTTTVGFNYGLDKVRFPSNLTASDDLTFTSEVSSVEPRNGGYLVRYHCTIAVIGAPKPGLVADWLSVALPRTEASFKEASEPRKTPTPQSNLH
ncbi:hypothetical protein CJ178_31705 [Rhodococcus sp. ACPA4]|uniref:hypothetical protein n=1 Tax=Rhodococcus sp. ACPA4 TaxID=2028571 RepID=UPI000BB0CDA2|nr:hypothetical protein [Rhodococcus sp. ACPA4]PBC35990.1 hypothetical protein CJ178_31705 [Rhodococcus sp. ACPA4]